MSKPAATSKQDQRYAQAAEAYGGDIARFIAGYERDAGKQQELLQEVHLALWQSFTGYAAQCSLRTWVYRVAHNVGVTHIQSAARRVERGYAMLDQAEFYGEDNHDIAHLDRKLDLDRVMALVHSLVPLDREVMLLYLEDMDAATIADVTGLSARNVATKVHRIKALLAKRFQAGNIHE